MTISFVRHASVANSEIVAMGGVPASGNLLVALVTHWFNNPVAAVGWTRLDNANAPIADGWAIFYKYAGGSEIANQTVFNFTGGASQIHCWEFTGVTGTIATDLPAYHAELDVAATTGFTSTSFNTGQADTQVVGLMSVTCPTSTTIAAPTISSGQTDDGSLVYNGATSRHAASVGFQQYIAASGTPVAYTATAGSISGQYGQAIFVELANAPAPGLTAADVSSLPILVLADVAAPARDSTLPLLALAEIVPPLKVSTLPILALCDAVPCATRWCQCWLFVRQDGEAFAFTSHDEPVSFLGRTYLPCESLFPTATEGATDVGAVGNMELSGVIADDALSEFDLYAGKFDGCVVEVWQVPWDASDGTNPRRLAAGKIGGVSHGRDGFKAEVLGPGAQVQQQAITQVVTAACRWRFGDSNCTKDLVPLHASGPVTGVSVLADRRIFADSTLPGRASPPLFDEYFTFGTVEFTNGPNVGLKSEVKSYDNDTGTFVLWQSMPAPIEVGHTYQAIPGCDLSKDGAHGCKFWSNLVNFGGFPDIPGDDAIAETPNAKY